MVYVIFFHKAQKHWCISWSSHYSDYTFLMFSINMKIQSLILYKLFTTVRAAELQFTPVHHKHVFQRNIGTTACDWFVLAPVA